MSYSHADKIAGHFRRPEAAPIDPALFKAPKMLAALAARDISEVYRRLTDNGVSQHEIARRTGQSPSEVCEIIGGRRVQSVKVLKKIADGLGVPRGWMGLAYDEETYSTYAEDRHGRRPPEGVDEEMKRRAFVTAAFAGVWGLPTLPGLDKLLPAGPDVPTVPTPLPSRVDPATVDALRALTERMRSLARFYGGQADTIGEIARSYTQLMTVDGDEPVKRALGSALAELHTVAGWAAFDSGLDGRPYFTRAMELSRDAEDAYGLANAVRHAGVATDWSGHPDDALTLYQLGIARLGPVPDNNLRMGAVAAWLHADSAAALAQMGHTRQAQSELTRARDSWQPPNPFEQADMDFLTARVQRDLGHLDRAEQFAATSVRAWGDGDRRDGVLAHILLATFHVQAGEPDGLRLAHHAITGVAQLRSVRARERLAPLVTALDARPGSDARELAVHARRVAAVPA